MRTISDYILKNGVLYHSDRYLEHHGVVGMKWGFRKYNKYNNKYLLYLSKASKRVEKLRKKKKDIINDKKATNLLSKAIKNKNKSIKQLGKMQKFNANFH